MTSVTHGIIGENLDGSHTWLIGLEGLGSKGFEFMLSPG